MSCIFQLIKDLGTWNVPIFLFCLGATLSLIADMIDLLKKN